MVLAEPGESWTVEESHSTGAVAETSSALARITVSRSRSSQGEEIPQYLSLSLPLSL